MSPQQQYQTTRVRVRPLAWGSTYNQSSTSSSSSVATVISSPADQSLLFTRHLWMSVLCGCKWQPQHTLVTLPLLQLLILLSHCCLFCLSLFTVIGKASVANVHFYGLFGFLIHACLYFLAILCCILHALLAGLLIKLCPQATSDDFVLFLLTVQCLKSFSVLMSGAKKLAVVVNEMQVRLGTYRVVGYGIASAGTCTSLMYWQKEYLHSVVMSFLILDAINTF